eukprot:Gregarina_sp_Poly_1__10252@NODE_714_length_6642_cov_66_231939_g539_i0_p3_GENE_NODE_714_length_6642_cov_66_231939_g539_i0NODE_714_length_6642_cov_66_231939_g539_i0_p3_ORF_typecomplete_len309_score36_50_NODE_714_length_6642_cov_66_231939_g539_i056146540
MTAHRSPCTFNFPQCPNAAGGNRSDGFSQTDAAKRLLGGEINNSRWHMTLPLARTGDSPVTPISLVSPARPNMSGRRPMKVPFDPKLALASRLGASTDGARFHRTIAQQQLMSVCGRNTLPAFHYSGMPQNMPSFAANDARYFPPAAATFGSPLSSGAYEGKWRRSWQLGPNNYWETSQLKTMSQPNSPVGFAKFEGEQLQEIDRHENRSPVVDQPKIGPPCSPVNNSAAISRESVCEAPASVIEPAANDRDDSQGPNLHYIPGNRSTRYRCGVPNWRRQVKTCALSEGASKEMVCSATTRSMRMRQA